MAHYDCTNCGSTEGIAFGLCSSCTPAEYFEVQKQIKNICYQADQEWNKHISLVKQQFLDDFYEKMVCLN